MDISLTSEQKVHVRLNPVTATGKPASLDGQASFTVSAGDATVVMDADGLGAFLVSGDVAGTSVVDISADVDLSAGVTTITESINLIVTDPQASSLGLIVSPAEPK